MCSEFKPVIPDTTVRFRDEEYRNEADRTLPADIELTAHPTSDPPALSELLPSSGYVPAPFESTKYRRRRSFSKTTTHVDRPVISGEAAVAVYGPHGEVSDQSVHLTCQITRLPEEDRTDEARAAWRKEKLWRQCQGDPAREIYSSWVTTSCETELAYDHDRTTYAIRRPRLVVDTLDTDVQRPVIEQAFVIQETDWGFVGTGAYLTPRPDEGEAREFATMVADAATKQALDYQMPSVSAITRGSDE